MRRLAAAGAGLLGLVACGLALQAGQRGWFAASLLLAVAVYFAAVRVSLGGRLAGAVPLVLAVAVAMRLLVLAAPPLLSGDVYRYVWDGRVQAAGINPYVFIPADPALAFLRDAAVYPNVNRAEYAPTIYPPMAQVVFAVVGRLWSSAAGLRLAMIGFEALAVACLMRMLALAGLPGERVLIYAWNPLAVWEFAGNGHVDAAAIGLLALALLLRVVRRDGWAGVALGAAVLVKFLPLAAAPAFWRARAGWRCVAGALAAVAVLYAIYAGAGWQVLGFLPGYGREEAGADGAGIWALAGLARLGELPQGARAVYLGACLAGLAVLAARVAFRPPGDAAAICGGAGLLMLALTCAASPHYPWYYVWLAMPAVLAPRRVFIWLSAAPALLYLDLFEPIFVRPALFFLPALVLGLADWRRGLPDGRPIHATEGSR